MAFESIPILVEFDANGEAVVGGLGTTGAVVRLAGAWVFDQDAEESTWHGSDVTLSDNVGGRLPRLLPRVATILGQEAQAIWGPSTIAPALPFVAPLTLPFTPPPPP